MLATSMDHVPKKWSVTGFVACACCICLQAQGAILVQYPFPSTNTWNSSDSDPNSTASTFTFSGMGTLGTSHGRSTATASPHLNTIFTRGDVLSTTEALALTNNDYYSFTLTPEDGYHAHLTSLTFLADATQGGAGISYTANFFVRSSLDSYTANLGTFSDGPSSSTNATFSLYSVDLTSSLFQNLDQAVTFRIYLYHTGSSALNSNAITRADTFTLNGTTVAIPEPSTTLLMGLAIAALWGLRRTRS